MSWELRICCCCKRQRNVRHLLCLQCVQYTVKVDSVSHLNPHENALTMNLVGTVRQPYSGVKSTLSPVRDYEFGHCWCKGVVGRREGPFTPLHPIPYLITTESLSFFDQTFSLIGQPGLRTTNTAARQEGKYSGYSRIHCIWRDSYGYLILPYE